MTSAFNRFEMKWQDQQVTGGQHHSPTSRSVPWEVSHPICAGAWQNNHNGLWKKGPNSAQQLNIHLGWATHSLQQTEPSTWPFPSPLQVTAQKTWNPFILAYISKLTRGGESTLCKPAPFVLGTHFLPEVSKHSSGEAAQRAGGTGCPHTAHLMAANWFSGSWRWNISWNLHCLLSYATEEHEASFKSQTAQHKFGLVSNTWKPLVMKLSHLLLCVHGSRLFHHMLLFFQEKMPNKANKYQIIQNKYQGYEITFLLGLKNKVKFTVKSSLPYQQCDLPTAMAWCLAWHTSTFLGHTCCLPQNKAGTPSMPDDAHQGNNAHHELSVKIKSPFLFKKLF